MSLYSSKRVVPESCRAIMNGHISDMKGNSSVGAAQDSSGLHKASRHHMTESDAVADKYGLAAAQRTLSCLRRKYCRLEDNVSPVWKRCLSRQRSPRHRQVARRGANAAELMQPQQPGRRSVRACVRACRSRTSACRM